MYQEKINIPEERIAVLIGKKGETKRDLQRRLRIRLEVNSKTGMVSISGEDSVDVFNAQPVINAIAHGFSPAVAKLTLRECFCLELINIEDFSGDSKKKMIRLKSRVIGTKGKSRIMIEKMTNCNVCVYNKTVGVIGPVENVNIARLAVEKLLGGAPHGHVYKFIQDIKLKNDIK